MQKGLVYMPYIISEKIATITEGDFKPKESLSSRYMMGGINMNYGTTVTIKVSKKSHKQNIDKIIERLI